jgi:FkbM family methyltransferase
MRRVRDFLGPIDKARYLAWRAIRSDSILEVQMRGGSRIAFRPDPPYGDLRTVYEIFIGGAYVSPKALPEQRPRFIVDVGANLGYSILYWTDRHPDAEILAFEPHPAHLRLLYQHLDVNGLTRKVRAEACALSNRSFDAFLVDLGCESALTTEPGVDHVPIKVRDFYSEIGQRHIDLLKIDIEGGEYPILEDPRFENLPVRTIVLEWHNTPSHPDGRSWCTDRFRSLGYRVAAGALDYGRAGILWAWRD